MSWHPNSIRLTGLGVLLCLTQTFAASAQVAGEPFTRSYNAGASGLGLGEDDFLTLRSPAQGTHRWSSRVWWIHSDDPVVLDDAGSNRLLSLVERRSDLGLGIQRRMGGGWRLGFELPLALSQSSPTNPVLSNGGNTVALARPASSGVGDIAFSARRGLGEARDSRWELETRLTLPSSADDEFLGEDLPSLGTGVNMRVPMGTAQFGVNAGFIFRERQDVLASSLGTSWYARSGVSAQVEAFRYSGVVESQGTFGGAHLGTEIQGGIAYVVKRTELGALAALGVLGGVGGADWRAGLSVAQRIGPLAAASNPQPVSPPPAPPATDPKLSSGVEQEDVDAVKPPEVVAGPDGDRDGVPDADDLCPDTPEDRDGYEDDNGCPDLDNDGDNLLDFQDQCPNVKGPPGSNGCPQRRVR